MGGWIRFASNKNTSGCTNLLLKLNQQTLHVYHVWVLMEDIISNAVGWVLRIWSLTVKWKAVEMRAPGKALREDRVAFDNHVTLPMVFCLGMYWTTTTWNGTGLMLFSIRSSLDSYESKAPKFFLGCYPKGGRAWMINCPWNNKTLQHGNTEGSFVSPSFVQKCLFKAAGWC